MTNQRTQQEDSRGRMISWVAPRRRLINIVLALCGIGITIAYMLCGGACTFIAGTVVGIDLKYLGIAFMTLFILLNLIKQDELCFFMLSFAIGAEIFLLGYQIRNATYCPFCIAFAATIAGLFIINFDRAKAKSVLIGPLLGLIFTFVWFEGVPLPSGMTNGSAPAFGKGKVQVRVYTDYFCGPCGAAEPQLEALIADLAKRNIITVTFVDTPIHKQTILYANYFLFIINRKNDFHHVLRARAALFKAARENIDGKDNLEAFLKEHDMPITSFDTKPIFSAYSRHLKEDGINATPTVVIVDGSSRQLHTGADAITKALSALKQLK